jgi:polysaccharide export outer membrane protein
MDRLLRLLPHSSAAWIAVALCLVAFSLVAGGLGRSRGPSEACGPSVAQATTKQAIEPPRLLAAPPDARWLPPLALDQRWATPARAMEYRDSPSGPEVAGRERISPADDGPVLRVPRPASRPDDRIEPPRILPAFQDRRATRSAVVEQAAREADEHTRRGMELAGRGAAFSARAEFYRALRLVAEALDLDQQTQTHRQALDTALIAMEETRDFAAWTARPDVTFDVAAVAAGHRTPVLHGLDVAAMSPLEAIKRYLTHAQAQLAAAIGEEIAGSMALDGLGKLHAANGPACLAAFSPARPKAMAFYQAALLVSPQNYLAANDLGALLAQSGRWEDARATLEHSLAICRHEVGERNLAIVLRPLGGMERPQSPLPVALASTPQATGIETVRWLEPEALLRAGGVPARQLTQQPAPRPAANPPQDWAQRDAAEGARAAFWQAYCHGDPAAVSRPTTAAEYRLRPDDQLEVVYRLTRRPTAEAYRLGVGDEVRIDSAVDAGLASQLAIAPDGMISLRYLGPVRAAGKNVAQLRDELEQAYCKYYRSPGITVNVARADVRLEELRAAVDRSRGQAIGVRITPEGTIALPALGSVSAWGLTLAELRDELNERYRGEFDGIEVTPILTQRAPRFVYVVGAVRVPGRHELTGPTSVVQAIGLGGGWCGKANLQQVVVLRRGDEGCLWGTMVNLAPTLRGQSCPNGDAWVADGDTIVVPTEMVDAGSLPARWLPGRCPGGPGPRLQAWFAGPCQL